MRANTIFNTILCMLCIVGTTTHGSENTTDQTQTWEHICNSVYNFLRYRVPEMYDTTQSALYSATETGKTWLDDAQSYYTDHADEVYEYISPYMTQNTAIGATAATGVIAAGSGLRYGWQQWHATVTRNNASHIITYLKNNNLTILNKVYTLPLDSGIHDTHTILIHLMKTLQKDSNNTSPQEWVTKRFRIAEHLGQYTIGKETYEEVLAELRKLHSWLTRYHKIIQAICALGKTQYHTIESTLNQRIDDVKQLRDNAQREAEEQLGYITRLRRIWRRNNRTIQTYSCGLLSIPRLIAIGGIGYLWYQHGTSTNATENSGGTA